MTCRVVPTREKCPSAKRGCQVSQGDLARVMEAQRQDLNSTQCGMEACGHRRWTAVKAADAGGVKSRWVEVVLGAGSPKNYTRSRTGRGRPRAQGICVRAAAKGQQHSSLPCARTPVTPRASGVMCGVLKGRRGGVPAIFSARRVTRNVFSSDVCLHAEFPTLLLNWSTLKSSTISKLSFILIILGVR